MSIHNIHSHKIHESLMEFFFFLGQFLFNIIYCDMFCRVDGVWSVGLKKVWGWVKVLENNVILHIIAENRATYSKIFKIVAVEYVLTSLHNLNWGLQIVNDSTIAKKSEGRGSGKKIYV